MNDTNHDFIRKDLQEGLSRAGIGKRYHDVMLPSFGAKGERIKLLISNGTIPTIIREGKCLVIRSENPEDLGVFSVMMRALCIASVPVYLSETTHLYEAMLGNDTDTLAKMRNAKVLGLAPFCEEEETPFSKEFMRRIEFFLRKRLSENKSMFLLTAEKSTTAKWFSSYFRKDLKANTALSLEW
jgi:hypothetical protein